jgi:hypothetical protein
VESLPGLTIAAFLEGVASTEPAPGAGSAGGVALAMGIACARKAIAVTLRHHPDQERLTGLGTRLAGLSDQALAGADADATAFRAYIHAAPEEHAGLLDTLIAVDECLIAVGDEARSLLIAVQTDIYPSMAGDVAAGLALIAAARTILAACVAESRRALNP